MIHGPPTSIEVVGVVSWAAYVNTGLEVDSWAAYVNTGLGVDSWAA